MSETHMNSNFDMAYTLPGLLDVAIPRFSTQTVLDEFPVPAVDDYSGPAKIAHDNIASELSLQLPFTITGARNRVGDGHIDMRYDLIRHDPARGEEKKTIGRKYVPAQGQLAFRTAPAHTLYKIVLAPVAAALASEVVDKNVATAASLIKILFPDTTPQDNINMNARATIRSLADAQFAPHRFCWRLASLYLAAGWASVNDSELISNQRDLAPLTYINSVHTYDGVLAAWDTATQPIVVRHEGMADMVAPLIGILRLAASREPLLRTTNRLQLPTVAQAWPAIGAAQVYYTGPRLSTDVMHGTIDPSTVWEAAVLWCGQHGTFQLFSAYVATLSTLWTGPVSKHAPILQSERFSLSLPVSQLQPTILTPISQSYVTWRSESTTQEPPQLHQLFLSGAARALATGLAVRTYGYKAGMPYVGVIARADTERDFIYREFQKRGDAVPAMFHAQNTLRSIGCTGTLGGVLLSLCPEFKDQGHLLGWWRQQRSAFQWEELANLTNSVPRCCALLGVVRPLHTVSIPIVDVWYGPDVLVNARTVEEALQGLCYLPDLELAWQLTDARSGTVSTHHVTRVTNYRGAYSDWQFAPRYSKEYAKIEMVFKVTATRSALLAHTGPMGPIKWSWYVARPVVEEELVFVSPPTISVHERPQVHEDIDYDIGASTPSTSASGASTPTAASSYQSDDDDGARTVRTHEAAPGGERPQSSQKNVVPQSIRIKADLVHRRLKDAGQSVQWLEQLMLGLERQYETGDAWDARDREGRMRGAWDEVEQMDPTSVLLAVPNGARSNTALLMSQLYRAAAANAHSVSTARGWVAEAIRMGNRATALKHCSAISAAELKDWAGPSRVKQSPGLSDKNIKMALAAGVSPADLLVKPKFTTDRSDAMMSDEAAWQAAKTGAQAVEEQTTREFDELIRASYENGEINGDAVVTIMAYHPVWLPSEAVVSGSNSNPAGDSPPIEPAPEIGPVVESPEADAHVGDGTNSVAMIAAELIPGKDAGPANFGNESPPTTMSQPMPPLPSSTPKPPPPPPRNPTPPPPVEIPTTDATAKDNTPDLITPGDVAIHSAQVTTRMSFME